MPSVNLFSEPTPTAPALTSTPIPNYILSTHKEDKDASVVMLPMAANLMIEPG
jgi:hypothetical protein